MTIKKSPKNDPFADREAAKYASPIVSREFILDYLQSQDAPISLVNLCKELGITSKKHKLALRRRLRAMLRDNQIEQYGRSFWIIGKKLLIEGQLQRIGKELRLIAKDDQRHIVVKANLAPGSRVVVAIADVKNSNTVIVGKVVEVMEYAQVFVTGRLIKINNDVVVTPFPNEHTEQDIFVQRDSTIAGEHDDCVVIELLNYRYSGASGKIVEILGKSHERAAIIAAALRNYDIPYDWPTEISDQLDAIKQTNITVGQRQDLRDLPFITIDGEDAKDFDDAVYCVATKTGWTLYVAIADVSYYVKAGSALDRMAFERGNSVYFPGQVVPMLPSILSNGLCSLKPNKDRLAMVCEMKISKTGKLSKYEFFESMINSKARLTYTKAAAVLEDNETIAPEVTTNLHALHDLFKALLEQKQQRGAIELASTESKLIFDKQGNITEVEAVTHNVAHRIIEECMLCANVATAKLLQKHKIGGIYRVHEAPTADKLRAFQDFLSGLGLSLNAKDPQPIDYGVLLNKIANRKDASVIQTVLLRSMRQAIYSPDNLGHFGLAYSEYTHFTSPIRRYSDLLVHRQIKAILHNKKQKMAVKTLLKIAEHCSMTERRADEATRDVVKALKCQYISRFLGKRFKGIVSGVTGFGLFIEIKGILLDGLLHINNLGDDYFEYDAKHHSLVGEAFGKTYKLGMEIAVIVSHVDVDKRRVDFVLA